MHGWPVPSTFHAILAVHGWRWVEGGGMLVETLPSNVDCCAYQHGLLSQLCMAGVLNVWLVVECWWMLIAVHGWWWNVGGKPIMIAISVNCAWLIVATRHESPFVNTLMWLQRFFFLLLVQVSYNFVKGVYPSLYPCTAAIPVILRLVFRICSACPLQYCVQVIMEFWCTLALLECLVEGRLAVLVKCSFCPVCHEACRVDKPACTCNRYLVFTVDGHAWFCFPMRKACMGTAGIFAEMPGTGGGGLPTVTQNMRGEQEMPTLSLHHWGELMIIVRAKSIAECVCERAEREGKL